MEGQFDAVTLFETMLAVADKPRLLREVARVLRPGGRFALTLEEGLPLRPQEMRRMPGAETIFLIPEPKFNRLLAEAGFAVISRADLTSAHAEVARRLAVAFARDPDLVIRHLGAAAAPELTLTHRRWAEWLAARRVRKLAIVAERKDGGQATP